jgi:hypothetical protein
VKNQIRGHLFHYRTLRMRVVWSVRVLNLRLMRPVAKVIIITSIWIIIEASIAGTSRKI